MKKIFACILLTGVAIFAVAQKTINDPNAEKRSVSGYHGVAVSGNIELFLTQGNEESVVVSADDTKWRDKVITEVKDGILQIYFERKIKIQIDWGSNSKKIRAYVSVKDIDYLSSSGSGKTHIEGNLKADKLKIDISGSGNVEGGLSVKDFSLGLSGSADADLSGNAENSDLHISGSGNIRSYDFNTSFCKASISGSGNVKITVSKELSAHISGSGNIFIKGDGMIRDYSASGSGKFKRVN
ncbi:MAG: head GIN domain-containing protein [Chitinophagales bacterium]